MQYHCDDTCPAWDSKNIFAYDGLDRVIFVGIWTRQLISNDKSFYRVSLCDYCLRSCRFFRANYLWTVPEHDEAGFMRE